jgi:hypothetical protein
VWKAKLDALRGLKRALKKRRRIQSTRQAAPAEVLRLMNRNLVTPYLRRLRLKQDLRKRQAD